MDKAVHCMFMNETVQFVHDRPHNTENADIDTTSNCGVYGVLTRGSMVAGYWWDHSGIISVDLE